MIFKKIIDLTHTLNSSSPNWEGNCGFRSSYLADYSEHGYRVNEYTMRGGIGTHIDAPSHFIPNSLDIASLSLESLIVPAHVINVANKSHADYMVTPTDVSDYEKQCGVISKNSLVIFYTGWDKYINDITKYRNVDSEGIMHFPGILESTADILLKRNVAGIAIDTISPETGSDPYFPIHKLLLGAEKYIIENIANASLLPATGAYVFSLPLKIEGGTEVASRVIGIIFNEQ